VSTETALEAEGLFGAAARAQAICGRLTKRSLEHLDGRPHDDMAILAVQAEAERADG
jgi:hypothetical protein